MFYVLFRPPKKDSQNDSQSFSNGKTPKNYVRRVMKMDQDEKERIQKEIWEAQLEQKRQQVNTKPEIKLSRSAKRFLKFHLYAMPFSALASGLSMWGMIKSGGGQPPIFVTILGFVLFFLVYTPLFGGISLLIYTMIFRPWEFTRIPEDKLPPLDDSDDNQSH